MSGFIKRNTINPAGGVNPANVPNVSQYGWTKYEAAIVNQLISYVNDCLKYSESAKEAATYVQEQLLLVDNYTQFIMDGIEDFEEKYVDSLTKYATLNNLYVNMESLHEAVLKYHEEIAKFSKEAYDSAQESKSWALVSYVYCLESKNEMTASVTDWLATHLGAFPTVPADNTMWKVRTGGQVDVDAGGFIWNEGDNLVYTLAGASFNQIKKDFYTFKSTP